MPYDDDALRALAMAGVPISPTEARRLADAGVPGVPDFVRLTGRPLASRNFDPAPTPVGWVTLPVTGKDADRG
ncbi:hypothetical protein PP636_gp56 [Arthrobacter phage Hestia]|uniref:Uncharacterized protein n=1 Tax=Arthrobacter phage Hestia TaxID=2419609 RepID=A0A3G3M460_9CAUD|nr:hypothetical protein PP636_gp56 [Arthrobacter phage Hestia]AYR00917.1 hypothetical protein PBI_HESTIA_39 [Arthrobacter phage Hestia]